jgi:hypothetical protein
MSGVVFDHECLKEIASILMEKKRQDLVEYIEYLCVTLQSIDDDVNDEDDLIEEEYEVGKTDDGFYYLK